MMKTLLTFAVFCRTAFAAQYVEKIAPVVVPNLGCIGATSTVGAPALLSSLSAPSLPTLPQMPLPLAAAAPALPVVPAASAASAGDVLRGAAGLNGKAASGDVEGAARGLDKTFDGSRAQSEAAAVPVSAAASRPSASQPDWSEGVFLPKAVPVPSPDDALGVTVHRLSNGMTVYLSPNRLEPRVSYEVVVRAGSRHDPLEATGMAHYLEHMQFKGTQKLGTMDYAKEKVHLDRIEKLYDELFATKDSERRKAIYVEIDAQSQAAAKYAAPNEFDKIYASAGFTAVNAHTNYEETAYQGSFPSNKADVWARVEADRLTDPVYRIFLPELEAVYEEYNRGQDDPQSAFFHAGFGALFQGHPYERDVIGHAEHLKNPSISRMKKFFADHYRPNNMAVVLSGDFDRSEMLARLEKTFGRIAPGKVAAAPEARLNPLKGVQRLEVRFQAEEAVQIDWRLPPHGDSDEDAIALADRIINDFIEVRVNKAQKVKAAGTSQVVLNEGGAWFFIAQPKDGQTPEQAERVLMEEIARLKAGDFTEDDLRTAVTELEVQKKHRLQDNEERAAVIRESFVDGRQWEDAAGELERLKHLTKADVLRVLGKYLGEDRVVVYRRKGTPESEKVAKPVFTAVPIDTTKQSPFFKELAALPAKPLEPHFLRQGRDYRALDASWGKLYWTKNQVNDLFNLEFRFDRGTAHDNRLGLALNLLQVSGAGKLDAEQFQRTLDRLGSSIQTQCGERECVVRLVGLERNLSEILRLALLRFQKPRVAPGAFQDLVAVERGSRADRKLDPEDIQSALGEFVMRGKASEFLKEPTAAQLDALTESDLKKVLASVFAYRRSALYTGSRDAREVEGVLSAAQTRRRFKAPPKADAVTLNAPQRARVVFVHREGMKQAVIGAYAPEGIYDPKSRLDYSVYNAVMGGGMGGIYFQEVRESRALAYSASGGYRPASRPGDEGRVLSFAGTQADKAVQTARLLVDLMTDPPITPERYDLARRQAEESYRTEVAKLEEIPRRVLDWRRLGYKTDPRAAAFRQLSSYDRARLSRFVQRLRGKPVTLYVLGDRDRVDLAGLKKLGDFEERLVDELFPF